ncbi:hypothetical protein HN419_03000 [Candidatus Woesearchaeota archaeon]|jgi:hypothetical protein|nr:hypothetical protein [Candidatus Woesearchaeota archaeon]MBT3537034.1 hypothetical protein [Candidatus Woesearchaeota archaeon]MBT4697644.1 hypothetical protein [Candidatus Woesearchaeota archaeon]MBT4716905.1 hypothetical protein [Candidatus Woesearchaeota archaeon]MBT7106656.1 hypothetical protein [Candidatus Woesearchaeota archaeon]
MKSLDFHKALIFDTGPLISLTMNNLLWTLDPLKNSFKGEFIITPKVYKEVIEKPLRTRKFKFEALQVLKYIRRGVITVFDDLEITNLAEKLNDLANRCFIARGHPITIVHFAEVQVVACAMLTGAQAIVIDERTMRKLIEAPHELRKLLQHKLRTKIKEDKRCLREFKELVGDIKVLRSLELMSVAYDMGILDQYMPKLPDIADANRELIESVFWGLKLSGCAISERDLNKAVRVVLKHKRTG